jgi:hypothetical protein
MTGPLYSTGTSSSAKPGAPLAGECERHVEPGQREHVERLRRRTRLRLRRTEELAARGRIAEQLAHGHGGARRPGHLLDRFQPPATHEQPRSDPEGTSVACMRRLQLELRYRSNRRQRLAAKAVGRHPNEVRCGANLGGCVSIDGEDRVVAVHAAAIVTHLHDAASAVLQPDVDHRGAGIQRILH